LNEKALSILKYPLQQHICANLDYLLFTWKTNSGTVWNPRTICAWFWV